MDIDALFFPKRVAVIGASRDPKKVGRIIFENVLKSGIETFPINPNAEEISGVKCYPSILDIPRSVDLAVIAVKNVLVPKVLKECGEKGVKACIVISAGFSEIGRIDLENEVKDIAKEYDIAVLGPNCLGLLNSKKNLNATFMRLDLRWESYAIISQSGALGAGILDRISSIGYFVSVGNQALLGIEDFLEYFSSREDVRAIGIYLESVRDGRRFYNALRNCEKEVFVLKAGRTKSGSRAARSHTGALMTEDRIYSFAIKQAGKVRVYSLEEFLNCLLISSRELPRGDRVLIVTNSGGPAVLLSDYLEESGLKVVGIPRRVLEELNSTLPKEWSHGNPIDLLGDATSERYRKVLEILSREDFYDIVIFCLTPLAMTDVENIVEEIIRFKKRTGKLVLTNFIGGKSIKKGLERLSEEGIPNFEDGELLARVLSFLLHKRQVL